MATTQAALVTGGTGGIGSAVVAKFLADGFSVAVPYRTVKEWNGLVSRHAEAAGKGRLVGIEADVTDEDSVRAAVGRAATSFGGLRVLAHLVGGYQGGTNVEQVEGRTVRTMLESNLVSAFWAAKYVIPHAKQSGAGRLLFVSSRGAVDCYPGAAAYAAAKAGIHALVLTLAKELRESGTTVNAILPSIVDTAANRASMPGANTGAWVHPGEIARLLSFLASEGASATSGALIPIYGRA